MQESGNKTLILGIGNTLLGDEGAGIHAVRRLQEMFSGAGDVECLDGGTLSFTLAGSIEDSARLIVIDAAQLKREPGAVDVFEGDDMDRFLGANRRRSVHEVSLFDLLAIARLTDSLPAQRALIGIQPGFTDWSDAPTEAVARAIPAACDLAADLVGRWRRAPEASRA